MNVPRKRQKISVLALGASARHTTGVQLGELAMAPAPTQTQERLAKALEAVDQLACDQHDHVSFAEAWKLLSKEVAHAPDFDFRRIPPHLS